MNRTRVCLGVVMMIALLLGDSQPSLAIDVKTLRTALAAQYPRVDGSTSAHPLQRTIACDLLGAPCVWSAKPTDNVERTFIPDAAANIPEQMAKAILGVKHTGTHTAYLNLIEGKTDVILVARAPSADELQAAKAQNIQLDVRPAALDAFVFLVNIQNSVDNLSLETLRDIYAGKITMWTKLGVHVNFMSMTPPMIHAYQRERNSGSQELMEQLVMQGTPMIDAPNMIVTTMLGPFNAIGGHPVSGGGDPLGLGYSVYYYAAVMFAYDKVKMIGVNGVKPTSETIAARTYPLAAEVYVVMRSGMPQDGPASMYRDWLLTRDGQCVVAQSGYVPLP
jgi:phosphate transport system substrate-binding protein